MAKMKPKCKHEQTELYEWQSSIASIRDIRCVKCLSVFNRKISPKK